MSTEEKNYNKKLYLEKELLAPYDYLLQVKGKQLRLKIPLAFNHWLKVSNEQVQEIINTVNMLHVGTLLLDDIQDDAKVRRGMPAAHCVYGVPLALNAFLHVLTLTFERANKISPRAGQIVMELFLDAIRGQGREIYWRDNFICPTESHYTTMVEHKTGSMLMMPVLMMQTLSDNKTDYSKLGYLIGRYFQIRDDYCNLSEQGALEEWPAPEDNVNHQDSSYCEDITEGKYSLPIIHAMKTPLAKEIMDILRKRTEDKEIKKHCVSLLEKAGSLQYTREKLVEFDQQARAEVVRLGGNPTLEAVLDELMVWGS